MTVAAAAGFSLAMTILAASPGPGVFGVVGRALSSGVKKTLYMIAGIVTGDLLYLVFAIFGLTYVAKNMAGFFTIIRYAGAAYLIWTGFKTAFLSGGGSEEEEGEQDDTSSPAVYLSGIMVLYAHLAASLGQLVKTPGGRNTMNRSAGGIMMAAGAVLALKR